MINSSGATPPIRPIGSEPSLTSSIKKAFAPLMAAVKKMMSASTSSGITPTPSPGHTPQIFSLKKNPPPSSQQGQNTELMQTAIQSIRQSIGSQDAKLAKTLEELTKIEGWDLHRINGSVASPLFTKQQAEGLLKTLPPHLRATVASTERKDVEKTPEGTPIDTRIFIYKKNIRPKEEVENAQNLMFLLNERKTELKTVIEKDYDLNYWTRRGSVVEIVKVGQQYELTLQLHFKGSARPKSETIRVDAQVIEEVEKMGNKLK